MKTLNIYKAKFQRGELCDSKLSGLHTFDNTVIIHRVKKGKNRKVGCEFMRHQSLM